MDYVQHWEKSIRLYKAAGGQEPADEQKRQVLVRLFPGVDKKKTYELLKDYKKYDAMREHLRKKSTWMAEFFGVGQSAAHLTEGAPNSFTHLCPDGCVIPLQDDEHRRRIKSQRSPGSKPGLRQGNLYGSRP